jgi:hypothetical protein
MRYALDRLGLLVISLLGCLLLSQLVVGQVRTSVHSVTATLQPIGAGYSYVDQPAIQERLWHLPFVSTVIESGYADEDGLVGGNAAAADQDAMVGYGVHDRVYLPGGRQDRYVWYGCISIYGSGIAALFASPTGGRFALLHLISCPLEGVSAGPMFHYTGPVPAGVDDATGLAVQAALASGAARAVGPITVRGGTFVGLSGWPYSYEFSNNSCNDLVSCQADAHLCVVSDVVAQNWLLWLAEGHDLPRPKPPAFPAKRWNAFTTAHHRHAIPYRSHGKLRPEAHYWQHGHQWLGGVKHEETWHKPKRGRGYELMPFQRGRLLYWPSNHAFKAVKR